MISFEWDHSKNSTNRKKYSISFETAIHIFDDPYILSWLDQQYEYGEDRWISLGSIENEIIIVVVHTDRSTENEKEIIRIISARKANKKEQTQYFLHYRKE